MKFDSLVRLVKEDGNEGAVVTYKFISWVTGREDIQTLTLNRDDEVFIDDNGFLHAPLNTPACYLTDLIDGWAIPWRVRYCVHGVYHRTDGPAYINGGEKVYVLHGKRYQEKEYWYIVNNTSTENIKDVLDLNDTF